MGRVSLLTRRLPVRLQNHIHKIHSRLQLPSRPFGLLPRLGQGTADRLAHHAPMHAQLLGHTGDRADPELVLSTDLFEQLHFGSPVQRVSSVRASPESEYPFVAGWAKTKCRTGPDQNTEITWTAVSGQ